MSEHDDHKRAGPEPAPVDGELPEELVATQEELREAERLREALEGEGSHDLAELSRSLQSAWEPKDLDASQHEQLVRAAVDKSRRSSRGRVIYVSFGAAALAAAAAFAVLVGRGVIEPGGGSSAELVRSRSTQDLFGEPFPRQGGTSARMDRISGARGKDYRANLFARMGVR